MLSPVEAQPVDVFLYGLDVLVVFLGGIGVVEAQMALGVRVFLRQAEIEAQSLGVANVQISVRFRGKARHHSFEFAGRQFVVDLLADEIEVSFFRCFDLFAHSFFMLVR